VHQYLHDGFFVKLNEISSERYAIITTRTEKNGFAVTLYNGDNSILASVVPGIEHPTWE
jgi:hypothetical protein